jgi:hypothetical protein
MALNPRKSKIDAFRLVVATVFRLTAATNASKAQERSERRSHDIRPNSAGDSWPSENAADAV